MDYSYSYNIFLCFLVSSVGTSHSELSRVSHQPYLTQEGEVRAPLPMVVSAWTGRPPCPAHSHCCTRTHTLCRGDAAPVPTLSR